MVVVASNFEAPVEGVILTTPNTKLVVNDQVLGTATLYITQDNVVWGGGFTPTGSVASTLSLLYPTISLHAIQREPSPALYLQLNYELEMPELHQPASANQQNQNENDEGNGDDDDGEDEDLAEELDPITQIRFVPDNEAALQEMFVALLNGQALHPDTEETEEDFFMGEGDGDDGDDNDMFEDAEESSAEQTASRLQQMNLNHANGHQGNGDVTENGSQ